jgi:hypothetical protein
MNGTGHLSCLSIVVAFNVGLWKLRFTKTGETFVFNAGRILHILGFELLNPLIWPKGHCGPALWGTEAEFVHRLIQTAPIGGSGAILNYFLPQGP